MTLHGVTIGDKFKTGKYSTAVVVDFLEKKSKVTGKVVGDICVAKAMGYAQNEFDVPFSTVVRNKIKQ